MFLSKVPTDKLAVEYTSLGWGSSCQRRVRHGRAVVEDDPKGCVGPTSDAFGLLENLKQPRQSGLA